MVSDGRGVMSELKLQQYLNGRLRTDCEPIANQLTDAQLEKWDNFRALGII